MMNVLKQCIALSRKTGVSKTKNKLPGRLAEPGRHSRPWKTVWPPHLRSSGTNPEKNVITVNVIMLVASLK
jgi:hypothetical protein